MTGIALDPSKISNAIVQSQALGSLGVVSNVIPPEGEKCVSMQFIFDNAKAWYVNLTPALQTTLSQLRSLYIDASNCNHDGQIFFPSTGLTVPIKAGFCQLIPLINNRYGYEFYVYLNGFILDPFDTINMIATNVMLPPFNTNTFFARPGQQFIYQQANLSLPYGNGFNTPPPPFQRAAVSVGAGLGITIIQSNITVTMIGLNAPSNGLYSVRLDIGTTNSDGSIKQSIKSHIIKATTNNLINNVQNSTINTFDYFFFSDKININFPSDNLFAPAPLAVYSTVLSGADGGLFENLPEFSPISSISWTLSIITDKNN